ncbi:MBL fold metallo-hydrolase [Limnovirga soli]|uniref:MBL fold metallo-hydrolase n=1 Tax=Limnovirga soli TaxID=2656915 RepID=A0A8J8FH47_9BACT|nr:MBL fold metallo-hydrolase [Limnovirga soli]NNV56249.1 MBL fold metallo-hydrolase [Limnovirga soli]
MYIQQLYTGCLSEAAYFIESEGEAAVIDPMRDIEAYLQLAAERKATIKYIFETHFHADFVSGHIDLASATGAPIIYGPDTKALFKVHIAADGEEFALGKVKIKVLHTPGHTLESTCYLLQDEAGKDNAVFTGDTLFVGDVGRPDLSQQGETLTMNDLAGMLYESLQKKIMPLADDVVVYPAHGAGSSCGKNLGPKSYSTIGDEKQSNYALLAKTKEAFIQSVTDGLANPPLYFPINAAMNQKGYSSMEEVLANGMVAIAADAFEALLEDDNYVILDTRPGNLFTVGFVPGSIFIGLEGRFAEWAGSLLPFDKKIVLVTEPGKQKESITRLARVGFELFGGYLDGGFEAWQKAGKTIDLIIDVEPDELAMDLPFDDRIVVVDVRKETEFADGHVAGAVNIPLSNLTDPGSMANIDDTDNLYVHCASGYRSVIASSLIKRQGIHNLRNIAGGWAKIQEEERIEKEKSPEVLN